MIALLETIASTVAAIGELVLWAIVSGWNLIMAAITAALAAAVALLPHMSDASSLGEPEWLRWLSWFFPIGLLVDGLVTGVALWTAFLVVRMVLRMLRAV